MWLYFCFQKKDVERTIGIDTDYIETNDFNLESADKLFLVEVSPKLKTKILSSDTFTLFLLVLRIRRDIKVDRLSGVHFWGGKRMACLHLLCCLGPRSAFSLWKKQLIVDVGSKNGNNLHSWLLWWQSNSSTNDCALFFFSLANERQRLFSGSTKHATREKTRLPEAVPLKVRILLSRLEVLQTCRKRCSHRSLGTLTAMQAGLAHVTQ